MSAGDVTAERIASLRRVLDDWKADRISHASMHAFSDLLDALRAELQRLQSSPAPVVGGVSEIEWNAMHNCASLVGRIRWLLPPTEAEAIADCHKAWKIWREISREPSRLSSIKPGEVEALRKIADHARMLWSEDGRYKGSVEGKLFERLDALRAELQRLQSSPAPDGQPILAEAFADNGAHSHWYLIDPKTGAKVWSEDPEECAARGFSVSSPSPVAGGVTDMACPRVEQTRLHNPPESTGNCFSAVLAGLLKLPIEQIPEFDNPHWRRKVNAWLRPFGLAWIQVEDLAHFRVVYGIEGLWHETAGASPRDADTIHAVAGKDGTIEWDPHPTQTGLLNTSEGHGIFVALRPWEFASRLSSIKPGEVVVNAEGWQLVNACLSTRRAIDRCEKVDQDVKLHQRMVRLENRLDALRSGEAGKGAGPHSAGGEA
ncbi:MAG: hypothetical protein WC378_20245 [Opitutaceae bacterium]|jgi:hypothetical protein